eukprot:gnl/TRDRNA2_/TRDRNA2_117016_c0_seq2.p1 gnl/TRDRNA2_/TRDRNA2_117016_c0~~gnl/TRDRNA2_/TRDRNA2_117016_c0_seq2.p1  ORF type:complete len:103 (+),score=20.08 gnl/TRDRNA2_/TRDRNA2_117016_c0_seq2:39-347(+)
MDEEVVWYAFRAFDSDQTGTISLDELKTMFSKQGCVCTDSRRREEMLKSAVDVLNKADTNGDRKLDFEEFMALFRGEVRVPNEGSAQGAPRPVDHKAAAVVQ